MDLSIDLNEVVWPKKPEDIINKPVEPFILTSEKWNESLGHLYKQRSSYEKDE